MNYTTINIAGLGTVALILFWLYRKTRDAWLFTTFFSAAFGTPVIGSQVWYLMTENAHAPSESTVALLYGAWAALLLGGALTVRRQPRRTEPLKISPINPRSASLVLVALLLAHLLYTVVVIYRTGLAGTISQSQYGFIDSFAQNRLDVASSDSARVGWYLEAWHNAFAFYVPLAMYMYRQQLLQKKLLLLILVFAGLLSLVLFSRVHFLMLITFALITWLSLFRPPWRKIVINVGAVACLAITLFVAMQSVLVNVSRSTNESFSDQIATYAFSSVPAFQELKNGNYYQPNPHDALFIGEGLYYVMGKLSLLDATEYPIGYREYVFLPDPTNVYTFLDAFTLDFGTRGAILGPFLMGAVIGWIYACLRKRITFLRLLLYCLCVYTCVVANLANFLTTPAAPIFLGTAVLLSPLVSTRARTKLIPAGARHATLPARA